MVQPRALTSMTRGGCGNASWMDSAAASRPASRTVCAPGVSGTHSEASSSRAMASEPRASTLTSSSCQRSLACGMATATVASALTCSDDFEPVAVDRDARRGDLRAVRRAGGRGGEPRLELGRADRCRALPAPAAVARAPAPPVPSNIAAGPAMPAAPRPRPCAACRAGADVLP